MLADRFVIQIGDRTGAFGWFAPVALLIPGDAATVVRALVERLAEADSPPRSGRRVAQLAEATRELEENGYRSISGGGTVDMRDAMVRLAELLPSGAQVVTGDGSGGRRVRSGRGAAWRRRPILWLSRSRRIPPGIVRGV